MNLRDKIREIEFKSEFKRELTPEEETISIDCDNYINNRLGEK